MFGQGLGQSGFNFEVPPESFIPEEDIIPDDEEDDPDYIEPMIVSVQLSDREKLKVCPRASATPRMAVGVEDRSMGVRSLEPMIVAIELGNRNMLAQSQEKEAIVDGESGDKDKMKRETQLLAEPVSVIKAVALEERVARPEPPAEAVSVVRRKSADSAARQEASAPVTVTCEVNDGSDKGADVSINGKRDAIERMDQSTDSSTKPPEEGTLEPPVRMQIEKKKELPQAHSEMLPPQENTEILPPLASSEIRSSQTSSEVKDEKVHKADESLAPPPPPPETMATEPQTTCTHETTPPIISTDERHQTSDQESSLREPQQEEQKVPHQQKEQNAQHQQEHREEVASSEEGALQMEAVSVHVEEEAPAHGESDLTEAQPVEQSPEVEAGFENRERELEPKTKEEQLLPPGEDSSTDQQIVEAPTPVADVDEGSLPQPSSYESYAPPTEPPTADGAPMDTVTSTIEPCNVAEIVEEKREDLVREDEMKKDELPPPPSQMESSDVSEEQELEEEKVGGSPQVAEQEDTPGVIGAGERDESEERMQEERQQPIVAEPSPPPSPSEAEREHEDKPVLQEEQREGEESEVRMEDVVTKETETPPPEVKPSPPAEDSVSSSDRPAEIPVEEVESMDTEPTSSEPFHHEDTTSSEGKQEEEEQDVIQPELREQVPEQRQVSIEEEPSIFHEADQVEMDRISMESGGDSKSISQSPLSTVVEPPSVIRRDVESEQSQLESDLERRDDIVAGELAENEGGDEAAAIDEDAPVVSPRPTQDEIDQESPLSSSELSHEGEHRSRVFDELVPAEPTHEGERTVTESVPEPLEEKADAAMEEVGLVNTSETIREEKQQEIVDEEAPLVSYESTREEQQISTVGEEAPLVSCESTREEQQISTVGEDAPLVSCESTREEQQISTVGEDAPLVSCESTREEQQISTVDEEAPLVSCESTREEQQISTVGEEAPLVSCESTREEQQISTVSEEAPLVSYESTREQQISTVGEEAPLISCESTREEQQISTVSEEAPLVSCESTREEQQISTVGEEAPYESTREEQQISTVGEEAPIVSCESTREEQNTMIDESFPVVTSADTAHEEQQSTTTADLADSGSFDPSQEPQDGRTTADDDVSETAQEEVAPAISPAPMQQDEEEMTIDDESVPVVSAVSAEEKEEEERRASVDEDAPVITSEPRSFDEQDTSEVETTAQEKETEDVIEPTNQPQPLDEPTSATDDNPDKQDEGTSLTGSDRVENPVTTPAGETEEGGKGEGQVEVSRESGLPESGQIEVDLLLHAEEDVFSAEAAEADKALTLSSSHTTGSRRKPHPHHHPQLPSPSSSSVPSSSTPSLSVRRSSKSSSNVSTPLDNVSSSATGGTSTAAATGSSSSVDRRPSSSSCGAAEASSLTGEKRQRPDKSEVRQWILYSGKLLMRFAWNSLEEQQFNIKDKTITTKSKK